MLAPSHTASCEEAPVLRYQKLLGRAQQPRNGRCSGVGEKKRETIAGRWSFRPCYIYLGMHRIHGGQAGCAGVGIHLVKARDHLSCSRSVTEVATVLFGTLSGLLMEPERIFLFFILAQSFSDGEVYITASFVPRGVRSLRTTLLTAGNKFYK